MTEIRIAGGPEVILPDGPYLMLGSGKKLEDSGLFTTVDADPEMGPDVGIKPDV